MHLKHRFTPTAQYTSQIGPILHISTAESLQKSTLLPTFNSFMSYWTVVRFTWLCNMQRSLVVKLRVWHLRYQDTREGQVDQE